MQTTLESKGWLSAGRMKGCMRYYKKLLGFFVFVTLVALTASDAVSYAIMRAGDICSAGGPAVNLAVTMMVAFISAVWATKHGARFLTRFGTPRTSVWLSTVLSLIAWMVALLILTFVVEILLSGIVLLLSDAYPDKYSIVYYSNAALGSSEAYTAALMDSLRRLPLQALWVAEWCAIFCFIGACLRRNKWLTLGVLIGVPMVLAITMLIPAVRETIAMVENADQNQLMALGVKWLGWISRAAQWVERNWQLLQGLLAAAALPLSWLVMRETPQP